MTISTTINKLDHLFQFIGYGNLDAPVWFLGMEEGGGSEEELYKRVLFKNVEDLKSANKLLGVTKFHSDIPVIQRTWSKMCVLMLRLQGHQEISTEMIRNYQANHLGQTSGDTLLLELMPIPKPSIKKWYTALFPQYIDDKDYYRIERPKRIEIVKKLITEHKPKLVIAYGKSYWPYYKALFPYAIYRSKNDFQWADFNGTRIVLSSHFTARTMNGNAGVKNLHEIITS